MLSKVRRFFCNKTTRPRETYGQFRKTRTCCLEPLERRVLLTTHTIFESDIIYASDPAGGEQFGRSVAITDDGLMAIVGASKDDEGARDAGAAYLLHYDGNSWVEVDKLVASSPSRSDDFGESVAIVGSAGSVTVVVGSAGTNLVSVFDCNSTGCSSPPVELTTSSAGDRFGGRNAVAISRHANGETLVIGDAGESGDGRNAGAAFVFERPSGGAWSQPPVRLTSLTPERQGTFGWSTAVSQDGTTIAVGARGSAEFHIFERYLTSGPFSQTDHVATITASSGGEFGWDTDLSATGEVLVASAMWSTFVTTRGTGWSDRELGSSDRLEPGEEGLNRFGWTVDVDDAGEKIVIGAVEPQGYVFDQCTDSSAGFCLQNLLGNHLGENGFGSIATNGILVLAGNSSSDAEGEPFSDQDVGAVHVYDLEAPVLPMVTIDATDPNAAEAVAPDPGVLTVTRVGDTSSTLDVFYSVSGSATSGVDYTALTGSVTINAGSDSAAIQVIPIDDSEGEGAESVIVTIVDDSTYVVGSADSDTVTIVDDDVPSSSDVIYVWDIFTKRRGPHIDLLVDVRIDSNGVAESSDVGAAGVDVLVELRDPISDALIGSHVGTTNSNGILKVKGLVSGEYRAEVTDLVLAGFLWDPDGDLDATSNDEDDDNDGLPDELVLI